MSIKVTYGYNPDDWVGKDPDVKNYKYAGVATDMMWDHAMLDVCARLEPEEDYQRRRVYDDELGTDEEEVKVDKAVRDYYWINRRCI